MYNLIKSILKVRQFKTLNKTLIYSDSENLYFNNIKLNEEFTDDFHIYENHLFWNKNETVSVLNIDTKEKNLLEKLSIIGSVENLLNQVILVDENITPYLYDFENVKKLNIYDYNWGCFFKKENKIIVVHTDRIQFYSLNEESITFEIFSGEKYLTDKQEIKHQYGILQEELLIGIGNTKIIAIDIHTGNITREWEEIPEIIIDNNSYSKLTRNNTFELHNDKLIGLNGNVYIGIDLTTSEVNCVNLDEEVKKLNGIAILHQGDISDEYIYYVMLTNGNKEKETFHTIIALNRTTFKLDWHHTFTKAGLGTNTPKIGGDKLYQLDLNQTLHIFEKETSE